MHHSMKWARLLAHYGFTKGKAIIKAGLVENALRAIT